MLKSCLVPVTHIIILDYDLCYPNSLIRVFHSLFLILVRASRCDTSCLVLLCTFPSGLYDNTFQPTAILIKHLILIILPLLLQTCAVGVGLTPKQVQCSGLPPGGHAGLADPTFSPPPPPSLFSKSEQQHRQLICFLLPPMPLLMSPPPLLSAALFPLRATFFLLVIFHSLLCLPLLNVSASASRELKSRLLAGKPIARTVCHLYIFGAAQLFWSLLAAL